MRYRGLFAAVVFLALAATSVAVQPGYFPLTIVRAEVKERDRVVYWLVDTPLYSEDPYFEVAVRAAGTIVVAERDPESKYEMLPVDWKTGTELQGRVDKHHLFLRRPNGTEMRFIITHRTKIPSE
jgi:hypothetical protein